MRRFATRLQSALPVLGLAAALALTLATGAQAAGSSMPWVCFGVQN